jgi:uncharacterized protein DUF2795
VRRESTQHGWRIDEALKREVHSLTHGAPVESRKEEWHEQEGAADGEREPSSRTAAPDALGPDGPTARAELGRHLRRSAFPADRAALLAEAELNSASTAVLTTLRRLPETVRYRTVYEVWEALGGSVEHAAGRPDRHAAERRPTP